MSKSKCLEDDCVIMSLYNYKNESGYRYCVKHVKTRLIDNKIQRMSNKSKNICMINLCSKDLSAESNSLCVFHYKLQLFKLENLINLNNIKDLNKLKKQYEKRLEQFNNLQNVEDINNFTNNHITKYKLQGLKNIDCPEQLEEFKNFKSEELVYLNFIDVNNLSKLKSEWNLEYIELTKNSKTKLKFDNPDTTSDKEEKVKKDSNPNCIIENCKVSANFNKKGLKAIYCSDHANEIGVGNKENELRNVRTKLCEHVFEDGLDCIKVALYGINKKQFCKDHIEEGMYKLSKNKECKKDGCKITPSYGFENNIAEYCVSHAEKGMIQLYQKCVIEDCSSRARYNKKGEKGSRYCSVHKSIDMKDNTKKECITNGCTEEANYNVKYNNDGIYCKSHKADNMCSNKVKICKYGECLINAYFGTKEDPKQYCVTHKDDKIHFNYHNQPEEYYNDIENNSLNKELKVKEFLEINNFKFIYNKQIKESNDIFRPDFLLEFKYHYIIIEVDENQHKCSTYSDIKENKRMKSLQNNLDKNVLIIRFNPDYHYINNERKYVNLNDKLENLLKIINENTNILVETVYNITPTNFDWDTQIIKMYFDCNCTNDCNSIHLHNI